MDSTAVREFTLNTPEEKEIVANALALYMDYLTNLGEGVEEKADATTKGFAKEILGGTMKDTIELRQRLIKFVGFDPTYDGN